MRLGVWLLVIVFAYGVAWLGDAALALRAGAALAACGVAFLVVFVW